MLAVEVTIEHKKLIIDWSVCSKGAKENFFTKLQEKLSEHRYDNIMLIGDFNAVCDTDMDKTSKKKKG